MKKRAAEPPEVRDAVGAPPFGALSRTRSYLVFLRRDMCLFRSRRTGRFNSAVRRAQSGPKTVLPPLFTRP